MRDLRLPRAAVVLAAGAMFGLAGAILQSVTRNPLAEPGLLGVTGGALLAIVTALLVAGPGTGLLSDGGVELGLVGVAGGMAAGGLTYAMSWRGGSSPALLILMGVLVAGTTGALAVMALLLADDNQVAQVLQWTIGSSNGRVWAHWGMIAPFALFGLSFGMAAAAQANALQMGDDIAAGLGLRVERTRLWLLFLAAWLTAGAVAVVGAIGFVGLVGPHLARLLVGQDARRLFPLSAAGSGLLLLLADILARTAPLGWLAVATGLPIGGRAGVPIGAVTPILGVPLFLFLLLRQGRRSA